MSEQHPTIAFIGAGNMASSIIGGLTQSGYPANRIRAADPNDDNRSNVSNTYGVISTSENATAVDHADVVVLAVKPQIMQSVCEALQSHLPEHCLVISIAAGVTCANLNKWLGNDTAIVRCMPNTPAQVGLGASGLFANTQVSTAQKQHAETILGAVGITRWVDTEALIDAVTAISGSSPAYFFLFIEAMVEAGVTLGLDKSSATELAIQSALGAATLAQQSEDDIVTLRQKVTSPNGTTEQAIKVLEEKGLRDTVKQAMHACAQRAKELAS